MSSWFETVAVAQQRAKRRLPASVYSALIAGAEAGVSMRDNLSSFDELGVRTVTAGQSAGQEISVTVMGQPCSMPVLISPTGVQAVHPGGEVAIGRAAAARGVAAGLSQFASSPVEDVVSVNPATLFQIYWMGGRDEMLARMERAKAAGAAGLIVTLDWSFSHGRDWGSPAIPESYDFRTVLKHAPEVLMRPLWLYDWLKSGGLPGLDVPNCTSRGEPAPGFFEAYGAWMGTPPPTWDDVAWLRSQWDGPFMVKGVSLADEASRAVDAGASAISVSNHGGNNVDGAPAPIRGLGEIAAKVDGQIDVLLDGGIRRGSDVVKAVAMGADAVMIGRASMWGLAAGGQAGVENVLDILRDGIMATMRGMGKSSLTELGEDDLVVPEGFTR